jgi:hypothetical protein
MEEITIGSRFKRAWNAFVNNRDPTAYRNAGYGHGHRPDRPMFTRGNERSIVTSIFNRIAIDVADISIKHVQLDKDGRFLSEVQSGLNNCLTLEANIDQSARAFIMDIVISMFDEGSVAIVPVDADEDPNDKERYDVLTMRTGKILEWFPRHVRVRVYNDRTGRKEDLLLRKDKVAIVENPLHAVVNEPNSTVQRLIRKLNYLDVIDEQTSSGKLDIIIQLPYTVRGELKRQQAEERRKSIETQLTGSKYGIAYADATEHITQLNRPVENNLLKQIEYLTSMAYAQLGITQSVMDGTADEKVMLNYNTRTIEPIISAIVDAMKRTFLTKTARTQGKSIEYFSDYFKLAPINEIVEAIDKTTRNEVMSKNEWRHVLGLKPSKDPKADQLINSNISQPNAAVEKTLGAKQENTEEGEESQNGTQP